MIFSHSDLNIIALDGSCQKIASEFMEVLRCIIWELPHEYIEQFVPNLMKDLQTKDSYLYASEEDAENKKYWFDMLDYDFDDKKLVYSSDTEDEGE